MQVKGTSLFQNMIDQERLYSHIITKAASKTILGASYHHFLVLFFMQLLLMGAILHQEN